MTPALLLRVKGNSMYPTICSGDIAFINRWAKPKERDIVVVKDSIHAHYLIKRIKAIKGDMCILEGDNKRESLSMVVRKKDIYGKVLTF